MARYFYFFRIALLLFLLSLTNISYAVLIESTKSVNEPGGVRYYFTVTNWNSSEDGFCSDMKAKKCSLTISGARKYGDNSGMVDSPYYWNNLSPSWTMAGVLSQLEEQGFGIPFKGSLFVPSSYPITSEFCITFVHGFQYQNAGGQVLPVGPCARVKKPGVECSVTGKTTINHPVVLDNAVSGNTAETQLQLRCTGDSDVIATAAGDNSFGIKLRDDGSLYSRLTINGESAPNGVLIKMYEGSPATLNLKSTLSTSGKVTPGPFSGSTILKISPP